MKTTNNDMDAFLAKWIDGQISDSELKKLVAEEDFKAYKKIRAGIGVFEQLQKPLNDTYDKIKAKIKAKKSSPSKTKVLNLYSKIAIAVAASLILFFSLNTFLKTNNVEYLSNFGEQKTVFLQDGSEVILNAKSQLKYNKKDWKYKREVYLEGEAFFKVTKGNTFTVVTNNGNITVLGTQFNINTNPSFFEVTCYQGKVKVSSKNNEFILTPNLSVRNSNGAFEKEKLDLLPSNPSWIHGESSFRRVPLKQVIMALEKQFNIKFDTTNIDDSIVFTGSFDNKNLNVALESVFETVNIKYTILDKKILLSK
jgi:ferric-dicitrate binding protein FerR (iron transport regulator)